MNRRIGFLLLVGTAFLAVTGSGSLASTSAGIVVRGTVTLRALKGNACKSTVVKATKETYISCSDVGRFRGAPAGGGASYAWRWRTRGKATSELGNLGINLGHGFAYFRLSGAFRPIGKVTTARGVARTTGTLRFLQGTFDYKGKTASGTYTFDVIRDAKTYRTLRLQIQALLR